MTALMKEKVIKLHKLLTDETGGDPGLRDEGLLESAIYAAFQSFGGKELYPSTEKKAARLCHSLIADHAFADGNKRIGMFVLLILVAGGSGQTKLHSTSFRSPSHPCGAGPSLLRAEGGDGFACPNSSRF